MPKLPFIPSSGLLQRQPLRNGVLCLNSHDHNVARIQTPHHRVSHRPFISISRSSFAHLHADPLQELWFTPSSALISLSETRGGHGETGSNGERKQPNERILKLGKTLRILSPRLPTLLINPLPQDILSPSISLHLFPSTHPHLPTVTGRVAYRAALWTAPVAWGSVPIVGNVKLQIMSERMVRAGSAMDRDNGYGDEKLVVRWRTDGGGSSSTSNSVTTSQNSSTTDDIATTAERRYGKDPRNPSSSSSGGTTRGLSAILGGEAPIFKLGKEEQFTGLFIFSFDEEGRIASHTIEHADKANGWDRTARVVTLTDWLLGKAKWASREQSDPEPALAMEMWLIEADGRRISFRDAIQSGTCGYGQLRYHER